MSRVLSENNHQFTFIIIQLRAVIKPKSSFPMTEQFSTLSFIYMKISFSCFSLSFLHRLLRSITNLTQHFFPAPMTCSRSLRWRDFEKSYLLAQHKHRNKNDIILNKHITAKGRKEAKKKATKWMLLNAILGSHSQLISENVWRARFYCRS